MFPKSTELPNKFIAKEKFYSHGEFIGKIKASMTDDISKITAINQFSSKTLNIEAGQVFPEIMVLNIILKNKTFNEKILDAMDKSVRSSYVLFILQFNNRQAASIAFKDKNGDNIAITKRWITPWTDNLDLKIEGRSIDGVYENLIKQISGGKLVSKTDKSLKTKVLDMIEQEKIMKKIAQLENKMDNEPQLKKKLAIKADIKALKEQL